MLAAFDMSRLRRYAFDRLRTLGLAGKLPYDSETWWDKAYDENKGANVEWGGVSFEDLENFSYCPATESYPRELLRGKLLQAKLSDDDICGRALHERGDLLVLGGGTSSLSRDMHHAGWKSILDVDFSARAIEHNKGPDETPGLGFAVADARVMRPTGLPPAAAPSATTVSTPRLFDACIDKGLVDALWCSGAEGGGQIQRVSESVASTLKPGGRFITLSFTAPDFLDNVILGEQQARSFWSGISTRKLQHLYMYILERSDRGLTKTRGPPEITGRRSGERERARRGSSGK